MIIVIVACYQNYEHITKYIHQTIYILSEMYFAKISTIFSI